MKFAVWHWRDFFNRNVDKMVHNTNMNCFAVVQCAWLWYKLDILLFLHEFVFTSKDLTNSTLYGKYYEPVIFAHES